MLIPGGGAMIGKALTKILIGSALKVAAIGGIGYAGYHGTKKLGSEVSSHKSLIVGTGLAVGGIYLYSKMK